MKALRTARLWLRPWRDDDLDALERLHADPEVAYWLAGPLSREAASALLQELRSCADGHGWGVRAVCFVDGTLIGAAGLQPVRAGMPVSGVEATWRLASPWWGHGYVDEAMRAILDDAFAAAGLDEVVAFTSATNLRSQAVMRHLGFRREPALDFDHPRLAEGHPLRRHVFCRLPRAVWAGAVGR